LPERAFLMGKKIERSADFSKARQCSIPPCHGYRKGIPCFVANISLTHKTVHLILPPRKRKFLSEINEPLPTIASSNKAQDPTLGTKENRFPKTLNDPYYPVKVIAGKSKSPDAEHMLDGDNDGLVPVESTKLTRYPIFYHRNRP
jgi:hypothetical protein